MKDIYDEKCTYNQLLIVLPSRYEAVRDTQRQQLEENISSKRIQRMLARLQEKEDKITNIKELGHWASDKK